MLFTSQLWVWLYEKERMEQSSGPWGHIKAGLSSFQVLFLMGLLLMPTSLGKYWWHSDRAWPLSSNGGPKWSFQNTSSSSLRHRFLHKNIKEHSACYTLVQFTETLRYAPSPPHTAQAQLLLMQGAVPVKSLVCHLQIFLCIADGLTSAVIVQVAQNCCWGHYENAVNFRSFPRK